MFNKKMIAVLLTIGITQSVSLLALPTYDNLLTKAEAQRDARKALKTQDLPADMRPKLLASSKQELIDQCLAMGNTFGGLWSLASDHNKERAFALCGKYETFRTTHPKAYAAITKNMKLPDVKVQKNAFKILGFSEGPEMLVAYTEQDITNQYNAMAKNVKDTQRLNELKAAYDTLMDRNKRAVLLEEDVEFIS